MNILTEKSMIVANPWAGVDAPVLPALPKEKPQTAPDKPDFAPTRPLQKPEPDVAPCKSPQVDPDRKYSTCRL